MDNQIAHLYNLHDYRLKQRLLILEVLLPFLLNVVKSHVRVRSRGWGGGYYRPWWGWGWGR